MEADANMLSYIYMNIVTENNDILLKLIRKANTPIKDTSSQFHEYNNVCAKLSEQN